MIHIILPVHNRKSITEKFINQLIQQDSKEFHLILVDDGSTDGTGEMAKSLISNLTILRGSGNLWWGGSLDLARKWAIENLEDEEKLLIINDDVDIAPNYLSKSLQEFSHCSDRALFFTPSFSKQTQEMVEIGVHYDQERMSFECTTNPKEVNCLSTRGLFLTVKSFKEIGSFFPKILPHYLSDYEYTIRAHQKGFQLIVSDEVHLFVDESTTGHHDLQDVSIKKFLKHYFSIRHSGNPFFFLVFILLRNEGFRLKLVGVKRISFGSGSYVFYFFLKKVRVRLQQIKKKVKDIIL